jgi:hypothetical protein
VLSAGLAGRACHSLPFTRTPAGPSFSITIRAPPFQPSRASTADSRSLPKITSGLIRPSSRSTSAVPISRSTETDDRSTLTRPTRRAASMAASLIGASIRE